MFGIGAFARLGQVSVRTLRYYDELGLLHPAQVDEWTGYRGYTAVQVGLLHRILALRDLGFALEEIKRMLSEELSTEQLRGMLRLRQAEARERLQEEAGRLARVEARLRQIDQEGDMNGYEILVKRLEPMRAATLHARAAGAGDQNIGPVLRPLYPQLLQALARAGARPAGPAMALYDESGDEDLPLKVTAAFPIGQQVVPPEAGLEVRELPDMRAATTIHHGPMASIGAGFEALMRWADAAGERVDGYGREVYIDCNGPEDQWVTELQCALVEKEQPGGR